MENLFLHISRISQEIWHWDPDFNTPSQWNKFPIFNFSSYLQIIFNFSFSDILLFLFYCDLFDSLIFLSLPRTHHTLFSFTWVLYQKSFWGYVLYFCLCFLEFLLFLCILEWTPWSMKCIWSLMLFVIEMSTIGVNLCYISSNVSSATQCKSQYQSLLKNSGLVGIPRRRGLLAAWEQRRLEPGFSSGSWVGQDERLCLRMGGWSVCRGARSWGWSGEEG